MLTSVRKILFHGVSTTKSFMLLMGQMSEEVQEVRNKYIKNYRENFSKKSSRKNINTDIFQRLFFIRSIYK
jgi:hypothetical protein